MNITTLDMRVFGRGVWLAMTETDIETSEMYLKMVLSLLNLIQSGK